MVQRREPEWQGSVIRLDELEGVVHKRRVRSRHIVLWGCPQTLSFSEKLWLPL